jgi:hypothetical protein
VDHEIQEPVAPDQQADHDPGAAPSEPRASRRVPARCAR